MSEDMKPTGKPEADEPAEVGIVPDWVKDPAQAWAAISKLKEKSTERLSEVETMRQRLDRLEAEKAQAEEKRLTDEKRWQELAEKRQTELENLRQQVDKERTASQQARIDNVILAEAARAGFVDPQEALALVDRKAIKLENDTPANAAEVVKALAEAKPHLLKRGSTRIDAAAPAGTDAKDDLSWHPLRQRMRRDVIPGAKEVVSYIKNKE